MAHTITVGKGDDIMGQSFVLESTGKWIKQSVVNIYASFYVLVFTRVHPPMSMLYVLMLLPQIPFTTVTSTYRARIY